ncbi:MAG TPA: M48 family metallopeptidase [Zoogloea sp.]|uniref:M48 family metallopeptidase n=1 Tax=Zoogloea sp. TaxID=49181 RepID=UPI002B65A9F5|nr:M48 family metallopeptidase [Zoogloea sp.]HMW52312.1 M48 family metallopeptidase [Rhodocyclaceae bacterium]HMZ75206.1 M48 family metallopeptidase [Rhodocyclaceae bacterium]HNI46968.1 M48 family metallopeptidase [Zoogloea sp.]HNO87243.1 M48 family metallopeptidase [Rhodocyclaceae bacterium]
MSTPVAARHYPPGGDAHGRAVTLKAAVGQLVVAPVEGAALHVPAARLQASPRGFNHSQWALAWAGADGDHLLIVDDAAVGPLRNGLPGLFATGDQARQRAGLHRVFAYGVLILACLALVVGGVWGFDGLVDRVVAHIPASVEAQIGEAVLARTRQDGPFIETGPAAEAVQAIGRRLTRPGETLQFHLVQSPQVNAFAAPGGVVVVYSALLRQAGSADEVAGVLAHEIAHVELRHSLRQLVRSAGLQVIAAALFGDYAGLGQLGAQLGALKFSRDAEREADARGLQRLADAHIDPQGLLRFFETLADTEGMAATMPAVLSTHPATAERIDALKRVLAAHPAEAVTPLAVSWPAVHAALDKTAR